MTEKIFLGTPPGSYLTRFTAIKAGTQISVANNVTVTLYAPGAKTIVALGT